MVVTVVRVSFWKLPSLSFTLPAKWRRGFFPDLVKEFARHSLPAPTKVAHKIKAVNASN